MNERAERISINIKKLLNLENLKFELIKNGITIIVGQNNCGKTRLLDYIYQENEQWDKLNEEFEESSYKFLPIFFRDDFYVFSDNEPDVVGPNRLGDVKCSYELYYFDLESSISLFATSKNKEQRKVEFKKIKSRSCEVYYTDKNVEKFIGTPTSVIIKGTERTKPLALLLKYKDEEGNFDIDAEFGIRGRNPGMKISHSPDELGSGLLKYESLKNLMEQILEKRKNKVFGKLYHRRYSQWEEYTQILLIDEPELLLHPFLTKEIANLAKELEENDIATIMTTHSPYFLSHFVHSDKLNLIIMRKEKDSKLSYPLYFWELTKSIESEIKKEYKGFARPNEKIEDSDFYKNKWKRLLNEYTLKIFFSKSVLFVEGMAEYILFNNVLKEVIDKDLKDVEIIPIFGKFHYIFFNELAKSLDLSYWFLLDDDRRVDSEGNSRWTSKQEIFWEKYGKNETDKEINGIIHSRKDSKLKISWFFCDVEKFLGVELSHYEEINKCCKEYNIVSRAKDILDNLEKAPGKIKELRNMFPFIKIKKEGKFNND